MSRHTHNKRDKASFAGSFLLLVVVAGLLNLDLFAGDGVSGYNGNSVRALVEIVFNKSDLLQSPFLSISKAIPGSDVAKDRILSSHSYATWTFVIQDACQPNIRPIYSSHNYSGSFNIPHQNSDEDELFMFPLDVA